MDTNNHDETSNSLRFKDPSHVDHTNKEKLEIMRAQQQFLKGQIRLKKVIPE